MDNPEYIPAINQKKNKNTNTITKSRHAKITEQHVIEKKKKHLQFAIGSESMQSRVTYNHGPAGSQLSFTLLWILEKEIATCGIF